MENNEEYQSFRVYMAEYKTLLTEKYKKNLNWRPPRKDQVLAVIPGTILKILVKENQKVKEGETLLILEAMKMENNIIMPVAGKITKINVAVGEVVPKNHVMIEFSMI